MTVSRKSKANSASQKPKGIASTPPAVADGEKIGRSLAASDLTLATGHRGYAWALVGGATIVLLLTGLIFGGRAYRQHARASHQPSRGSGYVDGSVCSNCHGDIAATFSRTGMGRSFYVPTQANRVERYTGDNTVDQAASGMHYTMVAHDGKFYQRRSTRNPDGTEANVLEESMDYAMGSGNHARAYLHRTIGGKLIELPISWYAEQSGYWAMTPGFDSKGQSDMHGTIGAECMFCHNAYPTTEDAVASEQLQDGIFPPKLPMGIDCQRCHGPGAAHVAAATSKATSQQIAATIVNPARLSRDRQLEVCLQCHLETSNRHSPSAITEYGRDIFSYRPGQPLADYKLYFERPRKEPTDEFEIAHAGYQLPKSACFKRSQMTCLTCHDPHNVPHGTEAIQGYIRICLTCHTGVQHAAALPRTEDCISCHMPKRRTDGSIHVVLTDHYIQRDRPLRDLLAPLTEKSFPGDHTPVELYYPVKPPPDQRTELLTAIAQVDDGDGTAGLAHLEALLRGMQPPQPEPYLELARAYVRRDRAVDALGWFDRALAHQINLRPAMQEKAIALFSLGRNEEAITLLRRAVESYPKDDLLLTDLGNAYLRHGQGLEAREYLERALAVNPERNEAFNLLGLLAVPSDQAQAESRFREAIRLRPDLPEAHDNLGTLLTGLHRFDEAASQFHQALFYDAKDAEAHHGLGLVAILRNDIPQASTELRLAAELKPADAQIREDLADLLAVATTSRGGTGECSEAIALDPLPWLLPSPFRKQDHNGKLVLRAGPNRKRALKLQAIPQMGRWYRYG